MKFANIPNFRKYDFHGTHSLFHTFVFNNNAIWLYPNTLYVKKGVRYAHRE